MRYPEFIRNGGRVGFIAPSFGCTGEYYGALFDAALTRFRKEGYETVEGENCRRADGQGKSASWKECAAEINDFFLNDRSDVILSCGGGETMCEDLSGVDFDGIRKAKPHWFLGYSDNTNLTFTLPTLCDTAAVYGPCAPKFSMNPRHECIADAWSLLKGEKLSFRNYEKWEKEEDPLEEDIFAPWNTTEDFSMTVIGADGLPAKEASFSGRLLGGCLDCLQVLCGTRFDKVKEFNEKYAKDGVIWFLESCDLSPVGMRRVLWQLSEAGWFEKAKGFLIGRPMHYDEECFGLTRISAVTGILSEFGVPVLLDLDIGHLPPQMPLIEGAMAGVKASGNSLSVSMCLS